MREMHDARFDWRRLRKPFLAVNKTGPDGLYRLVGGSFAADASGRIVADVGAVPGVLFVDFPLGPDGRIVPEPATPASYDDMFPLLNRKPAPPSPTCSP